MLPLMKVFRLFRLEWTFLVFRVWIQSIDVQHVIYWQGQRVYDALLHSLCILHSTAPQSRHFSSGMRAESKAPRQSTLQFPNQIGIGLLLKNTITRYNFSGILKNPAQNHTRGSTNFENQPETPIEFQHDLGRVGTEFLDTQWGEPTCTPGTQVLSFF